MFYVYLHRYKWTETSLGMDLFAQRVFLVIYTIFYALYYLPYLYKVHNKRIYAYFLFNAGPYGFSFPPFFYILYMTAAYTAALTYPIFSPLVVYGWSRYFGVHRKILLTMNTISERALDPRA